MKYSYQHPTNKRDYSLLVIWIMVIVCAVVLYANPDLIVGGLK